MLWRRMACVLAIGALCTGLALGQAPKKEILPSNGLAPVAAGQVQAVPPTGGGVDYSTSWVYGENAISSPPNAVKFQVGTPGTLVVIGPDGVPAGNFLAAGTFGGEGTFQVIYALDYGTSHLWTMNTTTGVATDQGACAPLNGGETWAGLTYDWNTGTFYGVATTCASSTLYTINVTTRVVTQVGSLGGAAGCAIDLTSDCNGNLYSFEIINDTFGSVDKNTGAYTVIGPLGFNANYAQGMCVDRSDGTVYLAAYNLNTGGAEWRSVDVNTGNTTLLGPIGAGAGVELGFADIAERCGPPQPGACCNDTTGVCTDNVMGPDCATQGGRFAPNTLCANMTPPCLPHGACCLPSSCVNNLTPAACQAQGGRFAGAGTVCAQLVYNQGTGGAWEDISGTGTHATAAETDDGGAAYPIGFTFSFYGVPKTQVGVTSNGYLTFGTTYTDYTPDPIPNTSPPNDLIAGLWRDLNATGRSVQYQTLGTAPNRYFIAQWTNVPSFPSSGSNTFQIVLFETTNKIEFRYQAFDATGYQAGVENVTGTVGTNVTSSVTPNSSLSLMPQPSGPDPCSQPTVCRGDLNCDGQINFSDINPFVLALSNFAEWQRQFPNCPVGNADVNGDGSVNFSDINPFVALISGGGSCH